MCALSKVVIRKGTNAAMSGKPIDPSNLGLFHFGEFELEEKGTVYFVISHGRSKDPAKKSGFENVREIKLSDLVNDPRWSWITDDLRARSVEIIRRIDDARGKRDGQS